MVAPYGSEETHTVASVEAFMTFVVFQQKEKIAFSNVDSCSKIPRQVGKAGEGGQKQDRYNNIVK